MEFFNCRRQIFREFHILLYVTLSENVFPVFIILCYIYWTLQLIGYRYISKPKPFDVFGQHTAYSETHITFIQSFFVNIPSFIVLFCW